MQKTVICTKCRKSFTLGGEQTSSKMVTEGVTCPFCGEPNEVEWPFGAGWTKTPPGSR